MSKDIKWLKHNMTDIFDIKDGYYNKKPPTVEIGTIPFLSATQMNNGV